jgi:transcriptional regulator of heat shock response
MIQTTFNDILEATDQLPLEDQENLVRILQNRLRDQKRSKIVKDVQEAEQEFTQGKCQSVTPAQLMEEILS